MHTAICGNVNKPGKTLQKESYHNGVVLNLSVSKPDKIRLHHYSKAQQWISCYNYNFQGGEFSTVTRLWLNGYYLILAIAQVSNLEQWESKSKYCRNVLGRKN